MFVLTTKNRVIEVSETTRKFYNPDKDTNWNGYEIISGTYKGCGVPLEDVVKTATKVEELCDEFVCLENKMTFQDLEIITSSCNLKHLTVYGAIWTNKGLKYVAKMNDKGELELL